MMLPSFTQNHYVFMKPNMWIFLFDHINGSNFSCFSCLPLFHEELTINVSWRFNLQRWGLFLINWVRPSSHGELWIDFIMTGRLTWHDLSFLFSVNQIRDTEVTVGVTIPDLDLPAALCGETVGEPPQSPDTITCSSPLSGRYVKVFRSSTENHFCVLEIEVFSS